MELEEGKVVTKGEEGKMFSAGIDLNEETGIRSVNGDAQKWQEEKDGNVMLDKYNFGIYGCWTKDDKGMLSYVVCSGKGGSKRRSRPNSVFVTQSFSMQS